MNHCESCSYITRLWQSVMPFQWFTQAILLQKEWGEEKCCDELIAQQKILMKGKEQEAQAEPGICPDEYANKKLVGRHFLFIFWQIVSGLWKACPGAMLGRAVGEPGDQSRKSLHLKPGMMININRWALTYTEVSRANDRNATEHHGHCCTRRDWSSLLHLFSSSTTWNLISATLHYVFLPKSSNFNPSLQWQNFQLQ